MSPRVVLVGVPGAGKTTVGRALADLLAAEFVDTDQLIEEGAGKTVSEVFIDDGEGAFRELERAAVCDALAVPDAVVSLGGGAVLNEQTRRDLAGIPTVWLQVGTEAAARRVGLGVSRPMLLGAVRSRMVTMARDRAPLYQEVASMQVETDDVSPEQIAAQIVNGLADRNG